MKIAFLPLFRENTLQKGNLLGIGTEYYSAYSLTHLVSFFEKHMPSVSISVDIFLPPILKKAPDLVVIWSTSSCFYQVAPLAEILKQHLDIPLILGGPHISYLPQSLPDQVDIGILGEPELTLKTLVQMFMKDPHAGPMKYGRIPGLIYQSRGRIYSGKPAQVVPNIDQLPVPKYSLFKNFPGSTIPIVQTSRGQPSMLALSSLPPSPKVRLHSPEYVVNELTHIQEHYELVQQHLPLPAFLKAEMRPVLIGDEVFVHHLKHLNAITEAIVRQGLDQAFTYIVNTQVQGLTEAHCLILKKLNISKVILHFPCLNQKSTPELTAVSGVQLMNALKTAKQFGLAVIGSLYLNHEETVHRRDIARTYWFLMKYHDYIERLNPVYCPPLPGSGLWERYQKENQLSSLNFDQVFWRTFQLESYQPNAPVPNKNLTKPVFEEIYKAFQSFTSDPSKFYVVDVPGGLGGQTGHQSVEMAGAKTKEERGRIKYAQLLQKKYLKLGKRALHLYLNPAHDVAGFIDEQYNFTGLKTVRGKIPFAKIKGQYDFILLTHALETLREPESDLKALKNYLLPHGEILCQTLNAQSAPFILTSLSWPVFQSFFTNPNLKYFSETSLEKLFDRTGFEIVKTDYTIMNNPGPFRSTVEGLAKHIQNFWPVPIRREQFYILEMMMLVKAGE